MSAGNTDEPATLAGRRYRYDRFTTRLLFRDLRFRKGAAGPGDSLPAFELVTTDGDGLVNQDLLGNKPLLLIFGSVTCPMTASAMPFLLQLHTEFAGRVATIHSPLWSDQRGVAAVLTLALSMLVAVGLIGAWLPG